MPRLFCFLCAGLLVLGIGSQAMAAEPIDVQVSPSTLNLAYEGTVVTVHADIPYSGVVTASLRLNGVQVWYTKADARGDLVAKFRVGDVKEIVAPPSATLTLVGMVQRKDAPDVWFEGTDTIRVVEVSGPRK